MLAAACMFLSSSVPNVPNLSFMTISREPFGVTSTFFRGFLPYGRDDGVLRAERGCLRHVGDSHETPPHSRSPDEQNTPPSLTGSA